MYMQPYTSQTRPVVHVEDRDGLHLKEQSVHHSLDIEGTPVQKGMVRGTKQSGAVRQLNFDSPEQKVCS